MSASEREKFFARASIGGGDVCWRWQGAKNGTGYGYITMRKDKGKRNLLAHRVAKEIALGRPLEKEENLHHTCENRLCVNPRHLVLTTRREHPTIHLRTHCKQGHELTEANTVVSKAGRICRTCLNAYQRERRRRKRAERE